MIVPGVPFSARSIQKHAQVENDCVEGVSDNNGVMLNGVQNGFVHGDVGEHSLVCNEREENIVPLNINSVGQINGDFFKENVNVQNVNGGGVINGNGLNNEEVYKSAVYSERYRDEFCVLIDTSKSVLFDNKYMKMVCFCMTGSS